MELRPRKKSRTLSTKAKWEAVLLARGEASNLLLLAQTATKTASTEKGRQFHQSATEAAMATPSSLGYTSCLGGVGSFGNQIMSLPMTTASGMQHAGLHPGNPFQDDSSMLGTTVLQPTSKDNLPIPLLVGSRSSSRCSTSGSHQSSEDEELPEEPAAAHSMTPTTGAAVYLAAPPPAVQPEFRGHYRSGWLGPVGPEMLLAAAGHLASSPPYIEQEEAAPSNNEQEAAAPPDTQQVRADATCQQPAASSSQLALKPGEEGAHRVVSGAQQADSSSPSPSFSSWMDVEDEPGRQHKQAVTDLLGRLGGQMRCQLDVVQQCTLAAELWDLAKVCGLPVPTQQHLDFSQATGHEALQGIAFLVTKSLAGVAASAPSCSGGSDRFSPAAIHEHLTTYKQWTSNPCWSSDGARSILQQITHMFGQLADLLK